MLNHFFKHILLHSSQKNLCRFSIDVNMHHTFTFLFALSRRREPYNPSFHYFSGFRTNEFNNVACKEPKITWGISLNFFCLGGWTKWLKPALFVRRILLLPVPDWKCFLAHYDISILPRRRNVHSAPVDNAKARTRQIQRAFTFFSSCATRTCKSMISATLSLRSSRIRRRTSATVCSRACTRLSIPSMRCPKSSTRSPSARTSSFVAVPAFVAVASNPRATICASASKVICVLFLLRTLPFIP